MTAGIGIDPGQRGGIARRTEAGTRAMPVDKVHGRHLTPEAARIALQSVGAAPGDLCYIEALSTRPGESPQSAATAKGNHATWVRACTDYGLVVSIKSTARLDRMAGIPRSARSGGKQMLCEIAGRLCPDVDLTPGRRTRPHDGMAEACLFALAAFRTASSIAG